MTRLLSSCAALLLAVAALGGCDRMANQPKQNPYELQPSQVSNPDALPPEGTVARDETPPPPPPAVTAALLEHGQQRYDIYCAPCHSPVGDGQGRIVQRGFPAPPSFFSADLLKAPSQHFYDVITHGHGIMYSYADRVAPPDRWAITAYIRALQASQHATLADVPADKRSLLQ